MTKTTSLIRRWKWIGGLAVAGLAGTVPAQEAFDFGLFRDHEMEAKSNKLFGVVEAVAHSSGLSIDAATANADPTKLATVAKGLKVKVLSAAADLAPNIDQMALWPNDTAPTHLIGCNEEGTTRPGVQRIRLSDGAVETILTGSDSCDPVRRTAWGTLLVGEEAGTTGQMIEILDPIATTNVLFDRVAGTFTNAPGGSGAQLMTTRYALGRLSFEGLALYPNGVVYYGDENRPATGTAGGAYFKFIPNHPYAAPPSPTSRIRRWPRAWCTGCAWVCARAVPTTARGPRPARGSGSRWCPRSTRTCAPRPRP
jgi:hypothetical protein